MKTKSGFTLIEILISLFIMALMITAFSKLMSTTFKGMRTVTQSTELVTEAQLATPIIVERLQAAACIFGEASSISFGDTILHMNTLNGTAATPTWQVGTDPVLAMFMPESSEDSGIYNFFAYYPILRSSYMSTDQIGPSPDVQNDASVWMILEYKHSIAFSSAPNCDGNEELSGGARPRYVADFVTPSNDPTDPYDMFELHIPPNDPTHPDYDSTDLRRSVTINLRFKRNNGKRIETLPTDGSLFSTKIFPRNQSYW